MKAGMPIAVGGVSYELQIAIDAPRERVWRALLEEVGAWWLPDFHMVGEDSTVTFDARAGGSLIEHSEDGGSLLWMTVQWIRPQQFVLYAVGHVAPDWGGPSLYHFKLELEPREPDRCTLKVSDVHVGRVDESSITSLKAGWTTLFSDGLKQFVERGVRYDH
ncbi:MAG: SRPBCC domain-containing protein [Pirellulales bacterium]